MPTADPPFPWRATIVAAVGYFVDLFDTFLVPALRVASLKELGVPDADSLAVYTTVFNWQLAGMALGALLLWGPFADRRGRREMLFGSIIVYGIASLLTAAVQTVPQYAAIRFLAGVGLGGELGAGVTLVAENAGPNRRGLATTIIGFCGMFGVVAAALLSQTSLSWRTDYVLGGVLAIIVLILRVGVEESRLFTQARARARPAYWTILRYLARWPANARVAACVLVGAPTFFVTGLMVPGAPEFGAALGIAPAPSAATAMIWAYLALSVGSVACGLLAQHLRSRRAAIVVFHVITAAGIGSLLYWPPHDAGGFYVRCAVAGFGIGYWANLVTNAAEQFGTNVRATVTITVPNLVRFLLFPISAAFLALRPSLGLSPAAVLVGISASVIAVAAVLWLPDGFSRDLDYNEELG